MKTNTSITIKIILLITGMGLIVSSTFAQRRQDVVYLKNGAVTRGSLLNTTSTDHNKDDAVRIETRDGNIFVYNSEEIDRIANESFYRRKLDLKEKGYYASVQTGLLIGKSWWGNIEPHGFLRFSNGVQLNSKFSVGVGAELNAMDYQGLMPLFAESRYTLQKGRTAPYLQGMAGYTLPLTNYKLPEGTWQNQGGIMLGWNAGIRHYVSDRTALDFSVGYRFQKTTQNQPNWWWGWEGEPSSNKVIRYMNRATIQIGLYFN